MYCKIFETQFQTVLLFETCLWQFWTYWVSETCLWQDSLYRGIYRPLSETAGPVCDIPLMWFVTGPHWWLVSIGSGNDLLCASNKPLHQPILTKFYDVIFDTTKAQ